MLEYDKLISATVKQSQLYKKKKDNTINDKQQIININDNKRITNTTNKVKKNNCKNKDPNNNDKGINTDNINKYEIIELFNKNIKGKKFRRSDITHDGSEGHWLEKSMSLKLNSNNAPDIGGYEMKKSSKKISFGDWSGEYLFSNNRKLLTKINKDDITMSKEEFIKTFGNKTKDKKHRYSWSGPCVPKYNSWNTCGQILRIDDDNNITAIYSYEKDSRKIKQIPQHLQNKEICICVWSKEKMEKHVNDKFNKNGFFICKKNKDNVYDKICFGPPLTFNMFLDKIKSGDIFFDSGMYHDSKKPNNRLYSQWRANEKFWNSLLTEEF